MLGNCSSKIGFWLSRLHSNKSTQSQAHSRDFICLLSVVSTIPGADNLILVFVLSLCKLCLNMHSHTSQHASNPFYYNSHNPLGLPSVLTSQHTQTPSLLLCALSVPLLSLRVRHMLCNRSVFRSQVETFFSNTGSYWPGPPTAHTHVPSNKYESCIISVPCFLWMCSPCAWSSLLLLSHRVHVY